MIVVVVNVVGHLLNIFSQHLFIMSPILLFFFCCLSSFSPRIWNEYTYHYYCHVYTKANLCQISSLFHVYERKKVVKCFSLSFFDVFIQIYIYMTIFSYKMNCKISVETILFDLSSNLTTNLVWIMIQLWFLKNYWYCLS